MPNKGVRGAGKRKINRHDRPNMNSRKHQEDHTLQTTSKRQKVVEERDNDPTKNNSSNPSVQQQLEDFNNQGPGYFNKNNPQLQDDDDDQDDREDPDEEVLNTNNKTTQSVPLAGHHSHHAQQEEPASTPNEASYPPMQLNLPPGRNDPRNVSVPEASSVSEITHPSMVTSYTVQNDRSNIICCVNDRVFPKLKHIPASDYMRITAPKGQLAATVMDALAISDEHRTFWWAANVSIVTRVIDQ